MALSVRHCITGQDEGYTGNPDTGSLGRSSVEETSLPNTTDEENNEVLWERYALGQQVALRFWQFTESHVVRNDIRWDGHLTRWVGKRVSGGWW